MTEIAEVVPNVVEGERDETVADQTNQPGRSKLMRTGSWSEYVAQVIIYTWSAAVVGMAALAFR